MNFFPGDLAPTRNQDLYAPRWFFQRLTLIAGPLLGLGLGVGLATLTPEPLYYIVKETVLGLIAGLVAPWFLPLAQRILASVPGTQVNLRHFLTYYLAGLGAGIVLWFANALFPHLRPPLDPANLLYVFGTAGIMPLFGFVTDALWFQYTERERTRDIFGKYVSESIAKRVLDAHAASMLEGETRTVTVLIADIRGFTRMPQELGAEEIVRTLNDYFTRMIDVIAQYDGTVDKFIGDAIVVLYNAPLEHRDANAHALATARAMQDAVRRMNAERAAAGLVPVQIGIALDVGQAVCGDIGSPKRHEYTAIGAPVNTAYHLASLVPAGQIYITEHVLEMLDEKIPVRLASQVELKGGTGTLNVYALDAHPQEDTTLKP